MKIILNIILASSVMSSAWAQSPTCNQGLDAFQAAVNATRAQDWQTSCTMMKHTLRLLASCETTSEATFAGIRNQKNTICNETGYSRDNQWCSQLPAGMSAKELARKGCM